MKPKTVLQKKIVRLSSQLPNLTNVQEEWGKNLLEKIMYVRSNTFLCMECGEITDSVQDIQCVCPNCKADVKGVYSLKRTYQECNYFSIFTTFKGFQVLRHFHVDKDCSAGQKAKYFIKEVVQSWISPGGNIEHIAQLRTYGYGSGFSLYSTFELRDKRNGFDKYEITSPNLYPRKRFIPELKRNGFNGQYYQVAPIALFSELLSNSKAETLLKAKQYSLFHSLCTYQSSRVEHFWSSIKICMRNNYYVKDSSLYLDYLTLLELFNYDLRNAKYVCPDNVRQEHDKLHDRRMAEVQRENEAKRRLDNVKDNKKFLKAKKAYLDIKISDGEIDIEPLKSIQDFIDESDALKHCVYSAKYYNRKDSLILSARINGQRIETVEVSLDKLEVVQSRGLQNNNTEYHDTIVSLVNSNRHLFKQQIAI